MMSQLKHKDPTFSLLKKMSRRTPVSPDPAEVIEKKSTSPLRKSSRSKSKLSEELSFGSSSPKISKMSDYERIDGGVDVEEVVGKSVTVKSNMSVFDSGTGKVTNLVAAVTPFGQEVIVSVDKMTKNSAPYVSMPHPTPKSGVCGKCCESKCSTNKYVSGTAVVDRSRYGTCLTCNHDGHSYSSSSMSNGGIEDALSVDIKGTTLTVPVVNGGSLVNDPIDTLIHADLAVKELERERTTAIATAMEEIQAEMGSLSKSFSSSNKSFVASRKETEQKISKALTNKQESSVDVARITKANESMNKDNFEIAERVAEIQTLLEEIKRLIENLNNIRV